MLDPPNGNLAIKTFWLVPNSTGGAHGGAVAQRGCPYYQCTPSRLYPAPFPPPAPPAAAPKANAQLPKAKGKTYATGNSWHAQREPSCRPLPNATSMHIAPPAREGRACDT